MTPALLAAKLALRSYEEVTFTAPGDVEVLIEENLIAFRGTEMEIRDILQDLRAFPIKDDDLGWVHPGFRGSVENAWPYLTKGFLRRPVVFIGHSFCF